MLFRRLSCVISLMLVCQPAFADDARHNRVAPFSDADLSAFCRYYEGGSNLSYVQALLDQRRKTLDDWYDYYDKVDCHDTRMTPIYRFVMNFADVYQPELTEELRRFAAMDTERRLDILNRIHVVHGQGTLIRARLTLLDRAVLFREQHVQANSPSATGYVAFVTELEALGAKRYRDMTEEERQNASFRSRSGVR